MVEKMTFNGMDMSGLFLVSHVHRDILPEREDEKRIIPVDITILDQMLLKREILSGIFAEDKYKSMIFSGEPDKEWFGKLVGQNVLNPRYPFYETTLQFELEYKTARSRTAKTYSVSGDTLLLPNDGTAPAPIKMTADFGGDCGFFAVVSPNGTIQVGEPEEVDTVPVEKSSVNIRDTMGSITAWRVNDAAAKPFHSRLNSTVSGTMAADATEGFLFPASFGTGASWHGPMLSRNIDPMGTWDGLNWEAEFFLRFEDRYAEKTGILEIAIVDNIGDAVFRIVFLNTQTQSSQNWIQCWAGINLMWEDRVSWYWQNFLGTVRVQKMGADYSVSIRNQNNGKDVSFQYHDPYGEVTLAPAKKLQIWHAAWGTEPQMKGPDMGVSEVKFVQHKTQFIEDVPNAFTVGDRLVIDTATAKVEKGLTHSGGLTRFGRVDIGSKFFQVDPGQTELRFLWSGFSQPPAIKVEIQERWW